MLKDGTGPALGSHGGGQASPAGASTGHPGTGSPCPALLAHRCGGTGGEDAHVGEHASKDCSAHTDTLQYGHDRHKHSPWCCSQTPALSQPQAQHLQQH